MCRVKTGLLEHLGGVSEMPDASHAVPADYLATLKTIKQRVLRERVHVVLAANSAMVLLYWDIGRLILDRQTGEGWGAKIIERLSRDLRRSFPDVQGFSTRNLHFMRRFADEFRNAAIVKQLASQLPWWHVVRLIQSVKDPEAREWYMGESIRQGWSRSVLEIQLLGNAYQRRGKAITNFETALPLAESRRAAEVFKDPYLFDFLGNTALVRERQVEQALVDHIQRFMLERGTGFAFVGRQPSTLPFQAAGGSRVRFARSQEAHRRRCLGDHTREGTSGGTG
jgi:predicted nuclease of restriction endonuclease-like (RecB) superfamily